MSSEQLIVTNLRAALRGLPVGADVEKSEHFSKVLIGLEFYIPAVLCEIYPEWKRESLDGFIPLTARKSAEREIEIFGLCWLITDQTQTPVHLHIQIFRLGAQISFLECKLGERGERGLLRMKVRYKSQYRHLHALEGREDSIDWAYKVVFGSRVLEYKNHIHEIVAESKHLWPELEVKQLQVTNPGIDDDGVWLFRFPHRPIEVQFESSTGNFPFLLESTHYGERRTVTSFEDSIQALKEWLVWPTAQIAMCQKYDAQPLPVTANLKVGIARNVKDGLLPLNGLRHAPVGDTSGWYIWAGTELSTESDFFVSLHISHLESWCSEAIPFLQLPPGWRFLVAPRNEDVWFDASLLKHTNDNLSKF